MKIYHTKVSLHENFQIYSSWKYCKLIFLTLRFNTIVGVRVCTTEVIHIIG